ncbi:MAG: hypothetical protein OEZ22_03065 [Spirochaetia bacterium]|nr:hypothetical protein [Spirochaetia bacterium]
MKIKNLFNRVYTFFFILKAANKNSFDTKKHISFIIFIIAFIFLFFCASSPQKIENTNTSDTSLNYTDKIKKNYSSYNKLNVSFVIKGSIDQNEIMYNGTLTSFLNKENINNSFFSVSLKDSIFEAIFFSLEVKDGYVLQTDHLRDIKIKSSLIDYKWVEIFGNIIPFHFYFPVLLGFPPEQIYEENSVINENSEKILYQTDLYETIVEFSQTLLSKIYFRTSKNQDLLALQFSGSIGKTRHFPKTIFITKSKSKDYIKMEFSNLQVQ